MRTVRSMQDICRREDINATQEPCVLEHIVQLPNTAWQRIGERFVRGIALDVADDEASALLYDRIPYLDRNPNAVTYPQYALTTTS